jgi:hypothetical protein
MPRHLFRVMAGLIPAIHAFLPGGACMKTWMPATSAGTIGDGAWQCQGT